IVGLKLPERLPEYANRVYWPPDGVPSKLIVIRLLLTLRLPTTLIESFTAGLPGSVALKSKVNVLPEFKVSPPFALKIPLTAADPGFTCPLTVTAPFTVPLPARIVPAEVVNAPEPDEVPSICSVPALRVVAPL